MSSRPDTEEPTRGLGRNFWLFWAGRSVSALGGSFTTFALPLLIFQLTGSALSLGVATALNFLPYLFFGLLIGAWTDRVDRRRLMIFADVLRALLIASVPVLAVPGLLSVWWIYAVGFASSTIKIAFDSGQFAAIPSLVAKRDLARANGAMEAASSAASIAGPLLAGVLVAVTATPVLLALDAASFLFSALALAMVRTGFNPPREATTRSTIFQDLAEGLRYALSHPVLRSVFAMVGLTNLFSITVLAQVVFYAKEQLGATDAQVAILYATGGGGILAASFAVEPLRRRLSFGRVALGATVLYGLVILGLALTGTLWLAALLWAAFFALAIVFNVSLDTLQQSIVPEAMLGRVRSIDNTIAWSAIPLGSLIGGLAIERTQDITLVYGVIGIVVFLNGIAFSFGALGRPERQVHEEKGDDAQDPAD